MTIRRHRVDRTNFERMLELDRTTYPDSLATARDRGRGLGFFAGDTRRMASLLTVLEPASREICELLRLHAQSIAAMFAQTTITEGRIEMPLGPEEPLSLPPRRPDSETHGQRWHDGFCSATILRDDDSLDVLTRVSRKVLRRSSTTGDEFAFAEIEALQAFYQGLPETPELVVRAMELTDPDKLQISDARYVLHHTVPEIQCLFHLLDRDEAGFNEALHEGVKLHKKYWSSSENRRGDPRGMFSLALTAYASLAYDRDMKVEVESDYVPRWLFEGGCADRG